jgi:hypothetical protein
MGFRVYDSRLKVKGVKSERASGFWTGFRIRFEYSERTVRLGLGALRLLPVERLREPDLKERLCLSTGGWLVRTDAGSALAA